MRSTSTDRSVTTVAAYYFCLFGALGAVLPYLPLIFRERGLSPAQIGYILAMFPLSRLLTPVFWGVLADSLQIRGHILRINTLLSGVSFVGLLIVEGFWPLLFLVALHCFFRAPLVPLADAAARAALGEANRTEFGRVRLWGSIAFGLTVTVLGLAGSPEPLVVGIGAAFYGVGAWIVGGLVKPDIERIPGVTQHLRAILTRRDFALFLIGTGLYYGGHGLYDLTISMHLADQGMSRALIGSAWGIAVASEVLLMRFAGTLMRRFSTQSLLIACAVIACIRWLLLATSTTTLMLLAAQPLHAVSFGLWYISMVDRVQSKAPDHLRSSVQSVATMAMALGMFLAFGLGGDLYEYGAGLWVFLAASVLAVLSAGVYIAALRAAPAGQTEHRPAEAP